jgi:hypothetical protein
MLGLDTLHSPGHRRGTRNGPQPCCGINGLDLGRGCQKTL